MYHERMKKSHYEAGFRWGRRLFQRGKIIQNQPTFQITAQKKAFANACLPLYQTYYPNILEEIKGLADGQYADYETFYTFLFSMYCFSFQPHCTCIAFHKNNQTIFARNSDFLVSLSKLYMNCMYQIDQTYAFQGNTTAFIEIEDGVNEYGLAVGLTFVCPTEIAPGIQAGLLVRYLLENCKTTREAISALHHLPIASAQTITIADVSGDICVAECNCRGVQISEVKDFVVATNVFHSEFLKPFYNDAIDNWRAEERYETAVSVLRNHQGAFDIAFIKDVLSGKYGFMCQYDRKKDADTVWSVIYDLTNLHIYRAEGNPSRKPFRRDCRMRFYNTSDQ